MNKRVSDVFLLIDFRLFFVDADITLFMCVIPSNLNPTDILHLHDLPLNEFLIFLLRVFKEKGFQRGSCLFQV